MSPLLLMPNKTASVFDIDSQIVNGSKADTGERKKHDIPLGLQVKDSDSKQVCQLAPHILNPEGIQLSRDLMSMDLYSYAQIVPLRHCLLDEQQHWFLQLIITNDKG